MMIMMKSKCVGADSLLTGIENGTCMDPKYIQARRHHDLGYSQSLQKLLLEATLSVSKTRRVTYVQIGHPS
jgi:hypothetical protein